MPLRWVIAILVLAVGGINGCVVSKSKYEAALADMESAKTELEKSRMLRNALEQQIKNLKNQNEKVTMDLEMMGSEIQRIKDGRENERRLIESREAEVGKKTKAMASKVTTLQREYQKLKSQNRALKDTIVRYQKELKQAREQQTVKASKLASSPPPPSNAMEKKETLPDSQKLMARTEPAPVASPLKGALAPVNINTASANDLVLFLGLTKDMADKVVANRPYRLRGELVAKRVIPKATFDVIKDRITATSP